MGDLVVQCRRGHTHAVFNMLQSSYIARDVGYYLRNHLAEKEFVPQHSERSPSGAWYQVPPRWNIKCMYTTYDRKAQKLYVPIAYCDDVINVMEEAGAKVEVSNLKDYEPRRIPTKMRPGFTDRPKQVDPIAKCSVPEPGMKGLNLQTGGGKTYSAVRVALNHGYATCIIVPGLVEQWIDDIEEYTDARKGKEIYKIEGFQSLALLAEHPEYKPDFFVASTRTMQMFQKCNEGYELLPWSYKKFFEVYGIGTKIVDECHKQFHANTMMDLHTNVPYNLYLSATFDQTSKYARMIFNKIFPESMRFGGDTYDKYVTVHFYNFLGQVLERKCVRSKGYIHALYEVSLMHGNKFDSHVNTVIIPLLNQYYINNYQKGHRCLVFCSTVEFATRLAKRLQQEYPHLKVSEYIAGSSKSVLDSSDLVVSTIGKSSTGLDWKGLRVCLNLVSVRSPVLTSQMLGRLRKINGEQLIYVDLCDTNISAQVRHAETRRQDLAKMAAKFYSYNGINDLSVAGGGLPPGAIAV